MPRGYPISSIEPFAGAAPQKAGPSDGANLEFYRRQALQWFNQFLSRATELDEKWWDAQTVAANLERKLGLFARSIARLDRLPVGQLVPDSQTRRLVAQTRRWESVKNSEGQQLKD